MIRITGGTFRSRLLETPSTDKTKPTMDKVRLGVFSALSDRVLNAHVLDLFAGSGSYGFEAISRGASSLTLVDKGYEQIKVIKNNARALDININCYMSDVLLFLNECNQKYDLIFIDPRYALEVYEDCLKKIFARNILADGGSLILESDHDLNIDETNYSFVRKYKYGITKIYIIRK